MELQKIEIMGFLQFESVTSLTINLCVNEHGCMEAGGILTEESFKRCKRAHSLWKDIGINSSGEMLFSGVITYLDYQEDSNLRYVEVLAATLSILADLNSQKRSFQNIQMTYREVLESLGGFEKSIQLRAALRYNSKSLETPLIQYKITDWNFCKQIAGRLQTVVLAGYTSAHDAVFIGSPRNKSEQKPYRLHGNTNFNRKQYRWLRTADGKYKKFRHSPMEKWKFSYEQNLNLGDWVSWEGMKAQIYKKESVLTKGRLETIYEAGSEQCYRFTDDRNSSIEGLTLEGVVLSTDREMIKVALDIDAVKNNEYSFPYRPESGNIFYSMPEPGMRVCVCFPDGYEEHGFIIHGKRAHLEQYPERDRKEFRSFHEKLLRMDPGTLQLLGEDNDTSNEVCISRYHGAEVLSNKKICMIAKGDIHIVSNEACTIKSGAQISVCQMGTENQIELSGNDIVYSAEKYVAASCLRTAKAKEQQSANIEMAPNGLMLDYIAGGIVSGAKNELELAILGGIPSATSFAVQRNLYSALGKSMKRS